MSDFIGSRISLISRSDIRYVGILHDIDSGNSTVALEQVTSYGTEGRKGNPTEEIPGSDTVYDFIVFRGSDVKDLRIENDEEKEAPPPVPNDPAIVGTSIPGGPQRSNFQPPGSQQFPGGPQGGPGGPPPGAPGFNPNMPPMGPGGYYGQYGGNGRGFYGQPPFMGGYPPQGFGPGPYGPGPGPYGMMPPGGRGMSMPPGPAGRGGPMQTGRGGPSSPPQNRGTPPGQQSGPASQQGDTAPSQDGLAPPPPPLESKPDVATALAGPGSGAAPAPAAGANAKAAPAGSKTGIVPAVPAVSPRPAASAVAQQEQKTKPTGSENVKGSDNDAMRELQRKVQEMRVTNGAGGSGFNANNSRGGHQQTGLRGGRGGRGGFRGYNAHHQQQPRKVEIPTTDYDFASANARFKKESSATSEVSAATDSTQSTESIKPASEQTAATTTSGTNSPAPGGDASIIPPQDGFYNRGKSFFDNISCENKERAELKEGERPRGGAQWRGEEVKRNIETFGQSSVDGNFVGRRGGGWRGGRGRGNMNYNRGRRGGRGGGYHSNPGPTQQTAGQS